MLTLGSGAQHRNTRGSVVAYNGCTYYAGLAPTGAITVWKYDGTNLTSKVVHTNATPDLHGCPSIEVVRGGTYEGYLVIGFSEHSSPMAVYRTDAAEDITAWTAIGSSWNATATYINLITIGAVVLAYYRANGPGGDTKHRSLYVRKSTDGGQTWGAEALLCYPDDADVTTFAYPYLKESNAVGNVIAFAYVWVDNYYSLGGRNRGIYYFYTDDAGATYKDIAGNTLTLPVGNSTASRIYTHADTINSWVTDIALGYDGKPTILYQTMADGAAQVLEYHHMRYDGSAWTTTDVCSDSYAASVSTTPYITAFSGSLRHRSPNTHVCVPRNNGDGTWSLKVYALDGSTWDENLTIRTATIADVDNEYLDAFWGEDGIGGMVVGEMYDFDWDGGWDDWDGDLFAYSWSPFDFDIYLGAPWDFDIYLGAAGSRRRFALLDPFAPTRL